MTAATEREELARTLDPQAFVAWDKHGRNTEGVMKDQRRNLRGHAEAVAARWLWHKRYANQNGGQMDFYDTLSASDRRLVREMVDGILQAAANYGRADK